MSESISTYDGIKIEEDGLEKVTDALTVETALQIIINNEPFSITMQSPGDEKNLVLGLLNSEGLLPSKPPHIPITKDTKTGFSVANVELPQLDREFLVNRRSLLSSAACGICGTKEMPQEIFEEIQSQSKLNLDLIPSMFKTMKELQIDFYQSGGSHAASIFDKGGTPLTTKEDVGRHNATDKAIGDLISKDRLKDAHFMLLSGRISYEIVVKCLKAKIPVLASVSAPSSLAVDFAKEFGLTLLAFCREKRYTIYASPKRKTG